MEKSILHTGIISEVTDYKLTVTIVNASACSSCHAKGACLASDLKEKEIDIFHFSGKFIPGQQVNLTGRSSQSYKAAFYGYLIPFILVFVSLLLSISITKSEGLSGLISLSVLIPYYGVLYLSRNFIKRSFEFEVSAIS